MSEKKPASSTPSPSSPFSLGTCDSESSILTVLDSDVEVVDDNVDETVSKSSGIAVVGTMSTGSDVDVVVVVEVVVVLVELIELELLGSAGSSYE